MGQDIEQQEWTATIGWPTTGVIAEICLRTGLSAGEAFGQALSFYHHAIRVLADGGAVLFRDRDGIDTEIVGLGTRPPDDPHPPNAKE